MVQVVRVKENERGKKMTSEERKDSLTFINLISMFRCGL